ncbi:hypothetical protein SAY86_029209 [Trapa natans]|uniref:Uncharacterized protein n=1 Tax=Trapa natans TaxID=22666 RepID=A0AAN7MKQ9_TRANT|nr:hypothetical protein SAY86_029209 [Trapa natans]
MINGLTGNNPLSTATGSPNNMQANNEWTSMQPQKFLAPSVEKEPLGFTISTNTETAATAKMAGKDRLIVKLGGELVNLQIPSSLPEVVDFMAATGCLLPLLLIRAC